MSESELYRNTFAHALREHVGRGRHWSVEELAEVSGLDSRRIYALMAGDFQANYTDILQLGRCLPASFLSRALAPAGVVSVSKDQEPMKNPRMLQSRICRTGADLARYLEDGILDHQERAQFLPVAERLREDLDAFLAANVVQFPKQA